MLISAVTAFSIVATQVSAGESYMMTIDESSLHNKSQASHLLGAMETMQDICDSDDNKAFVTELCNEVKSIGDEILDSYVCINEDDIPTPLTSCQKQGFSDYIGKLHYAFSLQLKETTSPCKYSDQSTYNIGGYSFTFKCEPI